MALGDIFTSCQGWRVFLLKVQNSLQVQPRFLGIVKVDTLKSYMASDRKKQKFSVGTGQSKSLFSPYYSIKDRSRIMSCDFKSHV